MGDQNGESQVAVAHIGRLGGSVVSAVASQQEGPVETRSFQVLSVWSLHVLPVFAWVSSGYSGFPHHKDIHITYTTCKLHTERTWNDRDSKPGPSCCEATVLTTEPPSRPFLRGRSLKRLSGRVVLLVRIQTSYVLKTESGL